MIEGNLVKGAKFLQSPHHGASLVKPTLLVMHFTASGNTGENDAKYFQNPAAKASAHIVVDRDGTITQCVPFNVKAWHAGVSTWRGKSNCNDYSIGIEIDNWGILTKREDGGYRSWTGQSLSPDLVLHAKNKLGNDGYWEIYPEEQLKALDSLTRFSRLIQQSKRLLGMKTLLRVARRTLARLSRCGGILAF